jgi:hypothetical protein
LLPKVNLMLTPVKDIWAKPHAYVMHFEALTSKPADEWHLTGINGKRWQNALACGFLQALFIHHHAIVEGQFVRHFCTVNHK